MKLLKTVYDILLLEYSEKLIGGLVNKFTEEKPDLSSEIARFYIKRFKELKDSPNIGEKDITRYSWNELEKVVDSNQKRKIKTGKIDLTSDDPNLIYNNNGIRLYKSNTLESCVKYGAGYRFCISSRGLKNQYHEYRVHKGGTIYFIFNDNLPKEMDDQSNFGDPRHVMVIIVYKNKYTVTDATNRQEEEYYNLEDMVKKYPWIGEIKNYLVEVKPKNFDTELMNLKRNYEKDKREIESQLQNDPTNNELIFKLDDLTKNFRSEVQKLRIEFNKF
jgi:hypothetical protein